MVAPVLTFRKMPWPVSVIAPLKTTLPPVRFWTSTERPALLLMIAVVASVTGMLPWEIDTSAAVVLVKFALLTLMAPVAVAVTFVRLRALVPPVTFT